ncbi:MAG TPA: serine hydrolase [Candidatus Obscuribacterales bacterium]
MKKQPLSSVLCLLVGISCLLLWFVSPFTTLPAAAQSLQNSSSTKLTKSLLEAVKEAKFKEVIDYGPYYEACPGADFCPFPARRIAHRPNVDVAVIQLDANGGAQDVANVVLSRDYPDGLVVPIDRNYTASSIRWRKWDIERWDGGTFSDENGQQLTTKGWTDNPSLTTANDILAGRESAPYQFMVPYPASLFKLLVAYRIMRLVDAGTLSLDQSYSYSDASNEETVPITRLIRDWMDPMIAYSDNQATRALLKLLHDLNQVDAMNAEFRNLGLGTLQINNTDPTTGGSWQPGEIHMTALDTARLLWLIEGASDNRVLWTRPDGQPVTSAELTSPSRAYLKGLLANQGYNEVLSTSNFGTYISKGKLSGAPNTQPGIPATVPDRWIDPSDGTVTVEGIPYGQDVRFYNNNVAEVTFAHKTGLTFNYGSDAGIVESLAGKPYRHYIIAFIANLGYRYADPIFADRTSFPCYDEVGGICYTQRIPALAKQIDNQLK